MSATDEPEQHSSRSILFWATAIVVIAILLGLSYFSGTLSGSRSAANEATPTVPPTATIVPSPTPIIITEAGVLRRIESKQILQTTTFRIDTLVRAKKEGSWFFNWGGQNLLLFVKGTVTRYRSERTESRACHRFTGDQNDRDPASTGESAERQPRRL